ncbi:MAG: hypothetical protein JO171_12135 [Paludibacterium sp.]|uniref:gp53-like domain-containing protein n=1 Tax=Paludibacterium sp. TaxID=1917523 RepID=UPI0025E5012B|nr:hypothetical protein [Paludibacterium sp.]MBV8047900.1 hypothetical protein [Paludibacterium sp.]
MSKVLGSQVQVGASGTAANNLVLDTSANNGSASLYMGAPGTPSVQVAMINALGQLGLGSLGSGSGVVSNANGTAIQLPGGYILQFGTVTTSSGSGTVTFPAPFPNACLQILAANYQAGNATVSAAAPSKSSVAISSDIASSGADNGIKGNWIALGN